MDWLLPSQDFSASWMKKRSKLWLTNLMRWLTYAKYIDVKR